MDGAQAVYVEYYQPLFSFLASRGNRQLKRAQHDIPTALRRKYLLAPMITGKTYPPDEAWEICKAYLAAIEERMAVLLCRHSIFYWLSLLRRTRPGLIAPYEDKTDPNTAALVRRIQELAIRKYGSLDRADDVRLSIEVGRAEILGGMFESYMLDAFGADTTEAMYRGLRASPQWVIVEFSLREYFTIPRLEGLAYEYWQASAAMRTIGKGASTLYRDGESWFDYVDVPKEMLRLIKSYDERIASHEGAATLFGTWHAGTEGFTTNAIIRAYPNVVDATISTIGNQPVAEFYPNFLLDSLDITEFWRAHAFMAEPYENKWARRLDSLLIALWGLSNHVCFPNRLLDVFAGAEQVHENERTLLQRQAFIQLVKRAYSTIAYGGYEEMARNIAARCRVFHVDLDAGASVEDNVMPNLRYLTHAKDLQRQMSIWSGGPFLPVIPHGNAVVIDLVSITYVLLTMFFQVRDRHGEKGTVFEQEVRSALLANNCKLEQSGVIRSLDQAEREIDVSLRIGTELYLIECYASERPLDYDIGRIKTIDTRVKALDEKCEQARSLASFIKSAPKGSNYDFTWATGITAFVVSPFVEWIWSNEPKYWINDSLPRIVSAAEVITFFSRRMRRETRKDRKTRKRLLQAKARPRYRKKSRQGSV
jgi:hypothetical protein